MESLALGDITASRVVEMEGPLRLRLLVMPFV